MDPENTTFSGDIAMFRAYPDGLRIAVSIPKCYNWYRGTKLLLSLPY